MPAPWNDDVERIFTFSGDDGPIYAIDDESLRNANFSEEQLREAFDEGFLTFADEPPGREARSDFRQQYLDWMAYLGFSDAEFDWDAWREHMGYNE